MEDDESVPDSEQDIRPRFHKSKTHNPDGQQVRFSKTFCCVCSFDSPHFNLVDLENFTRSWVTENAPLLILCNWERVTTRAHFV